MRSPTNVLVLAIVFVVYAFAVNSAEPSPNTYGNVLINRLSETNGVKAATFSHWLHRLEYTCRVCHLELEFEMEANATEITEEANMEGEYCGACHDGNTAFGHNEDTCQLCHNGYNDFSWNKFDRVEWMEPREHGNGVDWSEAALSGYLKPKKSIYRDEELRSVKFKKNLELNAQLELIPVSDFSHEAHTLWLDCANCHPDIFAIKKDKTANVKMSTIRKGQACGVCHGKVASPIEDCEQCHDGIGKKM